jgi:hypothetical protein
MARMIVVIDKQGSIKAAAKLSPENKYSPTMIEVKPGGAESMHEVEIPDELEATGLGSLGNYHVIADAEPRLIKKPVAVS